jgi:WhiB family redox-sensing transcriptional regulator
MPDETAAPTDDEHLPATLLTEAAADTRRTWSARSRCAQTDPELFFPPRDGDAAEARAICRACVVRLQCLSYAIAADEPYGIWGGLDPGERYNLQRRMRRAAGTADYARRGNQ